MIADILGPLYDAIEAALDWLIEYLTFCPFDKINLTLEGAQEGLGWLNWFIPFHAIIDIMTLGGSALLIYYAVSMVLGHTVSKKTP